MSTEGYDFAFNDVVIDDVAKKLGETATEIDELIKAIYDEIYLMQTSGCWDGESYTTFKEKCESYRSGLETLPEVLNAFKKLIDDNSTGLGAAKNTMYEKVVTQLEKMGGEQ